MPICCNKNMLMEYLLSLYHQLSTITINTKTTFTVISNPGQYFHTTEWATNSDNLTNMTWPSVPAGDTPQGERTRHTNPAIAYSWDIFLLNCSFSGSHAADSPTSAGTLTLFYSEPHIKVSVHPHHETDRWQLHRHGTGEGPGTAWKPIWQQGRAGMSDCERFGTSPELRSCVGKRPQSKKQVCRRGSEWPAGSSTKGLTPGCRRSQAVCCLFINVRLECVCIRSHDGWVHLLCTSMHSLVHFWNNRIIWNVWNHKLALTYWSRIYR